MGGSQSSPRQLNSSSMLPPIPLKPSTLELNRTGSAVSVYTTNVSGTQSFQFLIPRNNIAIALDTLRVRDTRERQPTIIFPAPPTTPAHYSAWQAALANNIGATVLASAASTPREIVALHVPRPGDDTTEPLIYLRDPATKKDGVQNLSAHKLSDTKVFIPLAAGNVAAALAHVQSADLPETLCVPVTLLAHGPGSGTLEVRYQVSDKRPEFKLPTFDFTYRTMLPPSFYKEGLVKDLKLQGEVTVFNPLPFNLEDVRVVLRDRPLRAAYNTDIEHKYPHVWAWQVRNRAGALGEDDRDSVATVDNQQSDAASTVRNGTSDAGSETSIDSCSDSELDNEINCMVNAEPLHIVLDERLSLRHGEARRLQFKEYSCAMRNSFMIIINRVGRTGMKLAVNQTVSLRNTADETMEPGYVSYFAPINTSGGALLNCRVCPGEEIFLLDGKTSLLRVDGSHSMRERGARVKGFDLDELAFDVDLEWRIVLRVCNTDMTCAGRYVGIRFPQRFQFLPVCTVVQAFSVQEFDRVPRGTGETIEGRTADGRVMHWLPAGSACVLVAVQTETARRKVLLGECSRATVKKLARQGALGKEMEEAALGLLESQKELETLECEHAACKQRKYMLKRSNWAASEDQDERTSLCDNTAQSVEMQEIVSQLRGKVNVKMNEIRMLRVRLAELVALSCTSV